MNVSIRHTIGNNTFWLSPERSIFWEEESALIIADLHFGKTGHFRKAGFAVPQTVYKEDLHRLFALIQHFKPSKLIIVGDMFHSEANREIDFFKRWRNDISTLAIYLIKGNHDVLSDEWYKTLCIEVASSKRHINKFCFVHDISEVDGSTGEDSYFFSGHLHPGIHLKSSSRQSLSFPCYYFGKQYAVLPAFSRFTGYIIVKPKPKDKVYAIVNNSVMLL